MVLVHMPTMKFFTMLKNKDITTKPTKTRNQNLWQL
jgi:hypothetical protein